MKVVLHTQTSTIRVKVQADQPRPVSSRPLPSGMGLNWVDTPLVVETNGQTQFNIFQMPTGRHYLLINGLEHYAPGDYIIQQVGPNVRLVWVGPHQILTSMKLIFRTIN